MGSKPVDSFAWPLPRIHEAIQQIANSAGGVSAVISEAHTTIPLEVKCSRQIGTWLESFTGLMEMEALAIEATYGHIYQVLDSCAPALIRLPGDGVPSFLVLVRSGKRRLTLLGPDSQSASVSTHAVVRWLQAMLENDPLNAAPIDGILDQVGLNGRRRAKARGSLFNELHADQSVADCWLLRPNASAPWNTLVRDSRLIPLLGSVALLHLIQYSLWILAWWLLGWMTVHGRFEPSLFYAWMLLLAAMVPFRMLTESVGGKLAIRAGTLLKRRMLAGACRLEHQEVRRFGIGQLLGRVIESEAVESLSVTGGFLALNAVVELSITTVVLGWAAGSWLHVLLLIMTLMVAAVLGNRFCRRQQDWTLLRIDLSNQLVENMIGHRTRLAQQSPQQWNIGEDEALEKYAATSRQFDRSAAILSAIIPRGWLVLGIIALAPAFITGTKSSVSLAVALGGVLLAYQALRNLIEGGLRLSNAAIAWRRIRFIVQAATRREPLGRPQANLIAPKDGRTLITAREIVFQYAGRSQPVLHGADLSVEAGQQILLEGGSGGGKSTLASILSGSRVPESGLLLLHGLDQETIGAANWRRRVAVSPQFHDNHVLMGTLLFNLLMGRRWPPTQEDVLAAEQACRELGLGPLLDRMPSGIMQMVGETGWQLSHGEKSRVYLARALLQRAELTILDESFGALDPQSLECALNFVLRETPTLLVIAHP